MKSRVFIVLTAILVIYSLIPIKDKNSVFDDKETDSFPMSINESINLKQEFSFKESGKGISIIIGTYMRTLVDGNMDIKIYQKDNNKIIYNRNLSFSSITDSSVLDFKCKIRKNKKYILEIKTKNIDDNNAIALMVNNLENSDLTINNENKDYSLKIGLLKYSKSFSNLWLLFFIAVINVFYFKYVKGCEKYD